MIVFRFITKNEEGGIIGDGQYINDWKEARFTFGESEIGSTIVVPDIWAETSA